jgi:hypothetical protein
MNVYHVTVTEPGYGSYGYAFETERGATLAAERWRVVGAVQVRKLAIYYGEQDGEGVGA